jgi:hypothetical protein
MVFQAGCPVEAFEGANEHNNTNKDGSNPDWNVELENFHRTAFNNLNASNNPGIPDLSSPLSIDAGDCPPGPLERVMNLGKSRIEMRISRSAWFPRDLCFLHS